MATPQLENALEGGSFAHFKTFFRPVRGNSLIFFQSVTCLDLNKTRFMPLKTRRCTADAWVALQFDSPCEGVAVGGALLFLPLKHKGCAQTNLTTQCPNEPAVPNRGVHMEEKTSDP